MLSLRQLHKRFTAHGQTVPALVDVSLDLSAGEFVAVQGPSGCGKSTLLLMAGGLLAPDSGEVVIADERPYRLSPDQRALFRARHVGFVFQQFYLIPYLNVRENILAAGIKDGPGLENRADALLSEFGLLPRARHRPGELSVGERQRAALARALINEPRLILADEPTGNLDADNAAVALTHLRKFSQGGAAVLLVTHDAVAAGYASRRIVMQAGQVLNSAAERHGAG